MKERKRDEEIVGEREKRVLIKKTYLTQISVSGFSVLYTDLDQ